jgi:hypothetical protein
MILMDEERELRGKIWREKKTPVQLARLRGSETTAIILPAFSWMARHPTGSSERERAKPARERIARVQ